MSFNKQKGEFKPLNNLGLIGRAGYLVHNKSLFNSFEPNKNLESSFNSSFLTRIGDVLSFKCLFESDMKVLPNELYSRSLMESVIG